MNRPPVDGLPVHQPPVHRVTVHIDRLVLRGFAREDRDAIAAGLSAELERLLAAPDLARGLMGRDGLARVRIGAVPIGPGSPPTEVGAQTARGIAQGITAQGITGGGEP